MTDAQRWLIFLAVLLSLGLLYLLAPVLTPFLISAILAYIADPLVAKLQTKKLSRTMAVIAVFVGLLLVFLVFVFLFIPFLQREISEFLSNLPKYLRWIEYNALPWLQDQFGINASKLNIAKFNQMLAEHWKSLAEMAGNMLSAFTRSGAAVMGWVVNLVLIPVVTFYLLRDWPVLMSSLFHLVPPRLQGRVGGLAKECDEVLGGFLRGQLSVMLALGFIYSLGLWAIGLDLAFLIGFISGLLAFVPYLGFIVGIFLASVAALIQFQDILHLLMVALVYGIGQAVESFVLTPKLIGTRIGLHPVGVIFAVMVGGQLFGFMGVLLALPVSAVLMVLLRHAHQRYLQRISRNTAGT